MWKLMPDKTVKPVQVRTGITDHTVTQMVSILHGDLQPGDELVIGAATARTAARGPGMGPRRSASGDRLPASGPGFRKGPWPRYWPWAFFCTRKNDFARLKGASWKPVAGGRIQQLC